MKVIPIKEYYIRDKVEEDSKSIYLFTDNSWRTSGKIPLETSSWYHKFFSNYLKKNQLYRGNVTQAVIRGLINAYPITTMIDGKGTQWEDNYFDRYKSIIDFEIKIIKHSYENHKYESIKYNSENQFGSGNISQMKITAPKCWEYLNIKLLEIGINNGNNN